MSTPKSTASTTERGKQRNHWLYLLWSLNTYVLYTSIAAVESVQKQGKICILDIDVQGVQKVKQSKLEPIYLFIAPPSKEALEKRLRGRGTETEEQLQTRLGNAGKELEYGYVVSSILGWSEWNGLRML